MIKELFQVTKSYNGGILQGKAYRVLQTHLSDVLTEYGLSIPEWKLLGLLQDNGSMRIVDLAKQLDVDAPLITALVNSLKIKKMISREADKKDKRVMYVLPTAKAKSTISEVEKKVRSMMKELLHGVSPSELASYIKVLQTIVRQGKSMRVKKSYMLE